MKQLTITLFLFLSVFFVHVEDVIFYVAPNGNDTNPGTIDRPFGTLEKAKNAIPGYKTKSSDEEKLFIIRFREGTYHFSKPVIFDESGPEKSIRIENYEDEKVIFSGGVTLPSATFRKVVDQKTATRLRPEARGKIVEFDLKANRITYDSCLTRQGFAHNIQPSSCLLFFNKEYLRLARWPNEGKLPIGDVIDPGTKPRWEKDVPPRGASFHYGYDRARSWGKANDIWLYGIFSNGYANDNIQVRSFDTKKKILTTVQPHIYGVYSAKDSSNWDVATSRHLRGYYVYNTITLKKCVPNRRMPGQYMPGEIHRHREPLSGTIFSTRSLSPIIWFVLFTWMMEHAGIKYIVMYFIVAVIPGVLEVSVRFISMVDWKII